MINVDIKKILLEALTQKQLTDFSQNFGKPEINPEGFELTDHHFDFGAKERIYIPLESEHSAPSAPLLSVKHHMEKHGFEIHDYPNGMAKDKYGRTVKIGRVLAHPKHGDPEILKQYNDDLSKRGNKSKSDLVVCISRHPHDILGMSTNRGWTSCMNMDSGSNRHYLKNDLQHGTHVAYLIHKDDKEIETPIARIALKKYVNTKEKSTDNYHEILRPENRQYGTGGSEFEHTVRNWTEKHFPLQKGSIIYKKHDDVYNDSFGTVIDHSPKVVDDMFDLNSEIRKNYENQAKEETYYSYNDGHSNMSAYFHALHRSPAVSKHTIDNYMNHLQFDDVSLGKPSSIDAHVVDSTYFNKAPLRAQGLASNLIETTPHDHVRHRFMDVLKNHVDTEYEKTGKKVNLNNKIEENLENSISHNGRVDDSSHLKILKRCNDEIIKNPKINLSKPFTNTYVASVLHTQGYSKNLDKHQNKILDDLGEELVNSKDSDIRSYYARLTSNIDHLEKLSYDHNPAVVSKIFHSMSNSNRVGEADDYLHISKRLENHPEKEVRDSIKQHYFTIMGDRRYSQGRLDYYLRDSSHAPEERNQYITHYQNRLDNTQKTAEHIKQNPHLLDNTNFPDVTF